MDMIKFKYKLKRNKTMKNCERIKYLREKIQSFKKKNLQFKGLL